MRRAQRTFGDGLIEDEVEGLSEEWMINADRVLENEQLIAIFFEELGKRHPKSKSPARKREQKKRWFRNGQKWRTGCEGRISVTKRRHGLNRCRYKGDCGMKRWVGLGVIADTLINIVCGMARAAVEP
jgi:hypothetical protein